MRSSLLQYGVLGQPISTTIVCSKRLKRQRQTMLLIYIVFTVVIRSVSNTQMSQQSLKISRGFYDTFQNPNCIGNACSNCSFINAKCIITGNGWCLQCTCFGEYRTYLSKFDGSGKCVKDIRLLYYPDKNKSMMIKQYRSKPSKCFAYRFGQARAESCDKDDPYQKWMWTRYDQIFHVKTGTCLEGGLTNSSLHLRYCSVSNSDQIWKCHGLHIQRQTHYLSCNKDNNKIFLSDRSRRIYWEDFDRSDFLCPSKKLMCCEFTNPSSFVLVLDTKTGGGERQVKIPENHKNCHLVEIFSLKKDEWKSFSSSDQVFSMQGKKLKWNFNKTSSLTTWSNKILRVNFQCTTPGNSGNSKNVCIIVKIKPEIPVATTTGPFMKSSSPKVATIVNSKNTVLKPRTKPEAKANATYTTIKASTNSSNTATIFSVTVTSTPETETGNKTDKTPRRLSTSHLPMTNAKETSEGTQIQKPSGDRKMQKKESSNAPPIVGGSVAALLTLICFILGIICFRRRSSFKKHPSIVEINGKQAGEKDNVSVANLQKNPAFDDGNGVYQEPDLMVNSASSACKLYEAADKHEYDYPKVEQRYEQPEQFEYDYADSSGISKPFKNGVHFSKCENTLPNAEKVNETKEDGEVVYNTIEPDDFEPVYHTLE